MRLSHEVVCPKCSGNAALRTNRDGFLQRRVLSALGVYPWKCGACGADFLWARRGGTSQNSLLNTDTVDSASRS